MKTQTKEAVWKRIVKSPTCWEWTGALRGKLGYGHLSVQGRLYAAHRLAWELTNGPIPASMNVLHHCDNPRCCRPDHLFLGTQRDNYLDMQQKGREVKSRGDKHWTRLYPERAKTLIAKCHALPRRGEQHPRAKLTATQVLAIRKRRAAGEQLKPLAAEYGVTFSVIHHIAKRLSWKHLQEAV